MHFLYGIAKADGYIDSAEQMLIDRIAYLIGISQSDMISIKSMFSDDIESAYKVLEIEEASLNEEVKKAYRKMAVKYHPDKVSHLGVDFQQSANEKFQKINEAYEKIKKERNLK